MITVTFFWWTCLQERKRQAYIYTADHVRRAKATIKAKLSVPHEFVVVTDKPEAFEEGEDIRAVEMDRHTFVPGTRYAKLMIYRPDAAEIIGERILALDIDVVAVAGLDPLVTRDEDLVLWRNPNFRRGPQFTRYNSSMTMLRAGSYPEVYTEFDRKRTPQELADMAGGRGTDQKWVSYMIGKGAPCWTQDDGVYGHGHLPMKGDRTWLPEKARIVFFPGHREPSMPEMQNKSPWIKDHYG